MASALLLTGRRSPPYDRPDMSGLRIVLIGKNGSENSRVGNTILGIGGFHSEASSYSQFQSQRISGDVEEKYVSVIKTSHLLQPNLTQHHIIKTVHECVSLSAPGPHVIIVVLQFNDFTEFDRHRVKHVLNLFSNQAINHTVVLTTDEETRFSRVTSLITYDFIHSLIKECGGGHLQFDETPGWRSELFRRIEEILKNQQDKFLICDLYKDRVDKSSVDGGPIRSGGSATDDRKLKESINTGEGGVFTSGKAKLNVVLCGNNATLKRSVSKLIRGTWNKPMSKPEKESKECVKKEGKINGRQISVIELPALTRLSEQEVMRQTLNCVSLCDPGVDLFILVAPATPLTNEDEAEMEKINRAFYSKEHFMVLFTTDRTVDQRVSDFVSSTESQRIVSLYGSRYSVMGLKDHKNSEKILKILNVIDQLKTEPYSLQMFLSAQWKIRHDLEQKLSVKENQIKELQQKINTLDSRERDDDLRIVLLGTTGVGKSSTGNTILGREEFESCSSCESITLVCQKQMAKVKGRQITVIDTPGLFNTELPNEEIKREISHCISMILPGPHVFLLLIPLGRFTQEEQDTVKIIQENFGENSLMYTMVLFTRGDELKNKTLDQFLAKSGSALKTLIETCGNRVHVFNNNQTGDRTQVSELLEKIDNMVKTNGGSYYSCKMFREMERGIQEQLKMILMERVEQLKREREELMKKHKEETERMMEEERRKHDKERKKREEEFSEREEWNRRDIKEREEREAKIQEEMKCEREEWEKQKQEEKQRREEEEERRRKKEQEMRDEYNQRHKQEKERLMTMMEEEKQNHEKERKRREEEFREREERYKTEMKSEREEWEKQKREIRQKREEEEERRRKIEHEMWDEYNHRLKRDRERMKMMIEEERHNRDKEKKKRGEEEERKRKIELETWDEYYQILKRERERRLREKEDLQFKYEEEKERMKKMMEEQRLNLYKDRNRIEEENIVREEQYKRDIKEIDEHERKIREEMKREREEWEKMRQQERQREEEEKERRTSVQLYQRTPDVQPNNDDVLPSDPECLRILLFGRTGIGKSATGNSILHKNEFLSEVSTDSVTTTCQRGVGEIKGRSVAVVDTPDLFNTTLTNEQVVEEILKCVSLSAPGPHVFIIVLSLGRITQEEKDILDVIKIIFGQKAAEFTIVLFTREDDLKKHTIEQYVERSKNNELKKLISDCGNRFLAFNNRKTQDQIQVSHLLSMIEEVKKNNQGQYFSNEMFEEAAISVEERMKILEENEKINQAKVEELEAKYEREFKRMIERLEDKKQRTEEESVKLEKKFREREETLRREFEEKEKSEQKKREEEDQKRSELEKQLRDEHEEKLEEMKREIEDLRSEHKKRQTEREEEEMKREEKYKDDQEKIKKEQEQIMAELQVKLNEETKKRDLEEQMMKEQEEKEREEWKRKIEEAGNDKREMIEEQQREWQEEKKREMREREEEERMTKEKHKKQLREKQEELEKMRKRFEREKEEERQKMEEERHKQRIEGEQRERENEEKMNEIKRHYEQLERERKDEWERREREDGERREEKRRRWRKMIEDLKQQREEEIWRREREDRERMERREKECEEMKQKNEEEIKALKKKHQDEARKQHQELNDFRKRKEQHIQELKERLGEIQNQLNKVKRLRKVIMEKSFLQM